MHRPFVHTLQKEYNITKKTLENQVAYRDRQGKEVEKNTPSPHAIEPARRTEKISKSVYPSPQKVGKIDHIVKENSLHQTFGPLHEKDYGTIGQVMEAFKNLAHAAHQEVFEDWIVKRATFMVCYLKDQIHHINLSREETQKLALMASKQFADQRVLGTFTSNNDAHFKAKGALRRQEKSLENTAMDSQKSGEKSVTQSHPSLEKQNSNSCGLSKAEQHLHSLIHRINNDCRTIYTTQEMQREHERALQCLQNKGLER